ncbi:hypothetical protein F0344_15850 [Streptomyces finlayi]|uniref:Secreted protein n=1 Tax=Streptomyces finlayi TaxID=67296 RepID=A0A7G7BKP8_9ACTN|nr:hypothetical protein [Streptomyces finlayi]QNE75913.1 hypothetical protein F0344_15850 [Streptomyces finlayi]
MNDDATPATAVTPDPVVPPTPAAAPDRPGRARRVILGGLPFVLVLGAVGGAAAYTKSTVDGADRTVTTAVWQKPDREPAKDPAGAPPRGRAVTELSKLLLPVPSGYRLGPDLGADGNDSETSGRKAAAAMKESGRGLAGRQRRELEKRIDRYDLHGLARRSYVADTDDLVVETQIVKMKDRKAVRDMYTFRNGLMDTVGVFRDGPKIKGHKHATCFRLPKDSKTEIDGMHCAAYDGGVFVTLSASGSKPFDASAVAELLKDQLDHIASPGEYI